MQLAIYHKHLKVSGYSVDNSPTAVPSCLLLTDDLPTDRVFKRLKLRQSKWCGQLAIRQTLLLMSKFTLFMVHGIGVHRDAGWADKAHNLLSTAWHDSIGLESSMNEHIDVVPITYDEVFEDYLDDFADVSKAVFSDALEINQSDRASLQAAAEQAHAKDRPALFSYILDVLLYKMDIVKEQVNVLVAKQLYEKISALGTQDNFGIVAHSLGTRVINDTLQNIRSGQADQANFYKQGYRLKFLMQLSDVTDLFGLPFQQDKYPPKDVYSYDTYDYLRTCLLYTSPSPRD